jgi:hypothetical protein
VLTFASCAALAWGAAGCGGGATDDHQAQVGGKADGAGQTWRDAEGHTWLPILQQGDQPPTVSVATPAIFMVDLSMNDTVSIRLSGMPTDGLLAELQEGGTVWGRPKANDGTVLEWVQFIPRPGEYYVVVRDLLDRKRPAVNASLAVTCMSGPCGPLLPDRYEPNGLDAPTTVPDLQYIGDRQHLMDLSISSADDEDWFTFPTVDKHILESPTLYVDADGPGQYGVDVTVFWWCHDGGARTDTTCSTGQTDSTLANFPGYEGTQGCSGPKGVVVKTNCTGTLEDSGRAWVRVKARELSAPLSYNLFFDIQ